jgi:hypothetical protein
MIDWRFRHSIQFMLGLKLILCDEREDLFNLDTVKGRKLFSSWTKNLEQLHKLAVKGISKFIKLEKAWCAWAAARSLDQTEMPPDFVQLLTGPLLRQVRRFLCASSKVRRARFGWSLGQMKRACATLPAEFISEKLASHAVTLSKKAPSISEEFAQEIEGIVDELLSDFTWSVKDLTGKASIGKTTSTAASFESNSAEGGGDAYLYDLTHGHGLASSSHALLNMQVDGSSLYFDPPDPNDEMFGEFVKLSQESLSKGAHWKVMGILEPLKLRVITKGPALAQWLGKGLQLKLHDYLRKLPMFQFIGHPVTADVLQDMIFMAEQRFGPMHYVSGDYSAATDKLNVKITEVIFERVLAKFVNTSGFKGNPWSKFLSMNSVAVMNIFRSLLYKGELVYSGSQLPSMEDIKKSNLDQYLVKVDGKDELHVPQRNGQLMGSILSFPILCLANYACVVMAMRRMDNSLFNDPRGSNKREYLDCLRNGMVQINGDDILFPVFSERMYMRWSQFLPSFGFEKSLGKNWLHRDFFTINSELFGITGRSLGPNLWRRAATKGFNLVSIPYMAAGLLIGQHKVSGRTEARLLPLQSVLELVLSSCRHPKRGYAEFIHYNVDWIRKSTLNGLVNIALPVSLGGLGVNLTKYGIDFNITPLQAVVGNKMFDDIERGVVNASQFLQMIVHCKSSAGADRDYVPHVPVYGKVVFLPAASISEVKLLETNSQFSTGVLTARKPIRDSDSEGYVSGVRLFRNILRAKRHLKHGDVVARFPKLGLCTLIHRRCVRTDIGSESQETKTVEPFSLGDLNSSVPTEYTHECVRIPNYVTDVDSGVSRDYTVSGPLKIWSLGP